MRWLRFSRFVSRRSPVSGDEIEIRILVPCEVVRAARRCLREPRTVDRTTFLPFVAGTE